MIDLEEAGYGEYISFNEKVEFTGSKAIDMSKATEVSSDIKSRLPSSFKNSVRQVNLTEQGITNVSPYVLLKYMKTRTPASRIIIDEISCNVARWPNEGTKEEASFELITSPNNSSNSGYEIYYHYRKE